VNLQNARWNNKVIKYQILGFFYVLSIRHCVFFEGERNLFGCNKTKFTSPSVSVTIDQTYGQASWITLDKQHSRAHRMSDRTGYLSVAPHFCHAIQSRELDTKHFCRRKLNELTVYLSLNLKLRQPDAFFQFIL
jgi:hypothetical protein